MMPSVSVCLSVSLSVCLSVYLSVCLSVSQGGGAKSLRVVAMDQSYHVDCYKCEVSNYNMEPQHMSNRPLKHKSTLGSEVSSSQQRLAAIFSS